MHARQAHPGLQPVFFETLTMLLLDCTVSLFTKALLGAKAVRCKEDGINELDLHKVTQSATDTVIGVEKHYANFQRGSGWSTFQKNLIHQLSTDGKNLSLYTKHSLLFLVNATSERNGLISVPTILGIMSTKLRIYLKARISRLSYFFFKHLDRWPPIPLLFRRWEIEYFSNLFKIYHVTNIQL